MCLLLLVLNEFELALLGDMGGGMGKLNGGREEIGGKEG